MKTNWKLRAVSAERVCTNLKTVIAGNDVTISDLQAQVEQLSDALRRMEKAAMEAVTERETRVRLLESELTLKGADLQAMQERFVAVENERDLLKYRAEEAEKKVEDIEQLTAQLNDANAKHHAAERERTALIWVADALASHC